MATVSESQASGGQLEAASIAAKLVGAAAYTSDIIPRTAAVVTLVRSPFPHATITGIDLVAARSCPGVLDIVTAEDFQGFRLGHEIADQPVLADGKVRYVGEPVVAIAAETAEQGRKAAAAVRVEYDELPHAVTMESSAGLKPSIHAACSDSVARRIEVSSGDWDKHVASVTEWVEGVFEVGPAQHAYMEPYAAYAAFNASRQMVEIYAATHAPGMVADSYRDWFARHGVGVKLTTPAVGGAFGAKYEHPIHVLCGEFARRLRRGVGLVFTRREDFISANPRNGALLWVRLGADRSGRLITKESVVHADNGAYSLHGPSVMLATVMRSDNLYRYRTVKASGSLVYTNTPPTQCQRGFGDPEATFAQEQLLDELAQRMSLSPFELRALNLVGPSERTIHGWRVTSCGVRECLAEVEALMPTRESSPPVHGDAPTSSLGRAEPELDGISASRRHARGLGVAAGMHTVGNRVRPEPDSARVGIRVLAEGLEIRAAEVDVGQGTRELLCHLALESLGVPSDKLTVILGDSEATPWSGGSYSSRTAFFTGNAFLDAAARLAKKCEELAAQIGIDDANVLAVAAEARRRGCDLDDLDVVGEYLSERSDPVSADGQGNRSPAYSFAVHGCQVTVDRWTGGINVDHYWAVHDAGVILVPSGARGQVIGGVLQAVAQAVTERIVRGDSGAMSNAGFLDYRVPTSRDAVPVTVRFVATEDSEGPHGAKGVAEIPLIPVAACIANAIFDAVDVRIREAPMEPETLLRALRASSATSQHA